MLAAMLVAAYWKCLATMGPKLNANFCDGFVSLLYTGPMELKTLTLSAVMYILIYLLPPTHRQWHTRRHSLVTDTLTYGRKRCKQSILWETSSKEKEDSVIIKNNYKSKLTNIKETLNNTQFSIPHCYKPSFNIASLTLITIIEY